MKFKKIMSAMAVTLAAVGATGVLTACPKKSADIVFWHTMGKSSQDILNGFIEDYNKNRVERGLKELKIEHAAQGGYTDIYSKLLKSISAKTLPTMAYCYPDHVADYIKAGAAVNLTSLAEEDEETALSTADLADYSAYWGEGKSYNKTGDLYSVPFSKSTEVVFYNANAFKWFHDNYGTPLTVPTKWCSGGVDLTNPVSVANETDTNTIIGLCKVFKEHFVDYFKAVNTPSNADATKIAEVAAAAATANENFRPLGYDSEANLFITLSKQFGVDYTSLNDDNSGNIDWAGSSHKGSDKARTLVKKFKDWYDNKLVVTQQTSSGKTYTSTLFTDGKCFMSIGSTGGVKYNVAKDFDVQVAMVPQQDSSKPSIISQGPSIVFFKNSKITDEQVKNSWDFYKFITDTDQCAKFSNDTGYEPARKSSYQSEVYKEKHDFTKPLEEYDLYDKVAKLTSEFEQSVYFTSPAFVGSATSRTEVGGLLSTVFLSTDSNVETVLDNAFLTAYQNTVWSMDLE